MQHLVVALIVVACAGYATWTLVPASLRRRIALALLALPLPQFLAVRARATASASSASGCGGCSRNPKAPPTHLPTTPQPIVVHRHKPR